MGLIILHFSIFVRQRWASEPQAQLFALLRKLRLVANLA